MSDGPTSQQADRRAVEILSAVAGVAAEIALDLEMTWTQAREIFANALFARAGDRYGAAERVASALDTTVRTVRQYRSKRRRDEDERPTFNMRRRVLHLLDDGPKSEAQLEAALPLGSDTNYARGALRSLLKDGLVTQDAGTESYRRSNPGFEPWYARPDRYDVGRLDRRLRYLARLLGSRVTPKAEAAQLPAALVGMYIDVPEARAEEFMGELRDLLARFDARWENIAKSADGAKLLMGGLMCFGHLGEAIDPDKVRAAQAAPDNPTEPLG